MTVFEQLRQVSLFRQLSDDDLGRICHDVTEVRLAPGEQLFAENDLAEHAYVVTAGTVEVIKATGGQQALLALREPGSVVGEMALLEQAPRMASVRARSAAVLLRVSKAALDELLESSPSASRALFTTLLARMRETNDRLRQSERMAQLGTLTAGVAHELNNPAAAARRASTRLDDELTRFLAFVVDPPVDGGSARRRLLKLADGRVDGNARLDSLTRSDLEGDVESWLIEHGVAEPWQLAPRLVEAGADVEVLGALGGDLDSDVLRDALAMLASTIALRKLVSDISSGTGRLSEIVRALKGYSFLDQAPVQSIDVVQGIEDTLVLLGHKLGAIRLVREFEPQLPKITAYGSELNQVWTNLIDNAADALAEVDHADPTLVLRARRDGKHVVVEVEDNGPSVPQQVRGRIFEAFVTSKPPGLGTGLGLQISYRIVVLQHRGSLTFTSDPGRTEFRVTLPIDFEAPDDPGAQGGEHGRGAV